MLRHYDGNTWVQAAIPAVPMISSVFGFTQADVWAVGRGGGVLHFDGSTWTALDAGNNDDLWGVWGTSSFDPWIVGGAVGVSDPLLLHDDGAAFTETRLMGNPKSATAMFKVGHRWDGAAWSATSAGPGADEDFVTLHGTSADHILAVGGRHASPRGMARFGPRPRRARSTCVWGALQATGIVPGNPDRYDDPDNPLVTFGLEGEDGPLGGFAGLPVVFNTDGEAFGIQLFLSFTGDDTTPSTPGTLTAELDDAWGRHVVADSVNGTLQPAL